MPMPDRSRPPELLARYAVERRASVDGPRRPRPDGPHHPDRATPRGRRSTRWAPIAGATGYETDPERGWSRYRGSRCTVCDAPWEGW